MPTITLRDYQRNATEAVCERWRNGNHRVILSLPTGGGKTETALWLMSDTRKEELRCLVIVDRLVLCDQWVNRMRRHGMSDTGILQGSRTSRSTEASFVVATAQTIASRGVPSDFGLVVVDECHYWHKSHQAVLESLCPATRVLGLSATPLNTKMLEVFDAVVSPVTVHKLIQTGSLVPSRVFIPTGGAVVKTALASVSVSKGDFKSNELDEAMRAIDIMGDVVNEWVRVGQNRPTIAFCVGVHHAKELAAQFLEKGISAVAVTQEDDLEQRDQLVAQFEAGEIKVLTSVNVLAVGFDSPIASCAIFARPTLSKSLHVQMAGRVIRLFGGKPDALMLDHAGNVERHGRIESFVLPESLIALRQMVDKVPRGFRATSAEVTCEGCGLVYLRELADCPECGHRRTQTVIRVLAGELQELTIGVHEALPGTDPQDISDFYSKALRYARWMGFRSGWAKHKTAQRFDLVSASSGNQISDQILPTKKRNLSWIMAVLNQDDLEWLEAAAKSRLKLTLEQINKEVQSFQIDTGESLGLQAISINRMRVDPSHALKAVVCAALATKDRHSHVSMHTISEMLSASTKGELKNIDVIARHVAKRGVGRIDAGCLLVSTKDLPFSQTDRNKIVLAFGSFLEGEIEVPCIRETKFAD